MRETLTPIDTAWLHMEDPSNLMMVTGVLTFTGKIDLPTFKRTFSERLLRYERFRQRVVHGPTPLQRPHWRTDPSLAVDAHVHAIALDDRQDHDELMRLIGELASTGLDFDRPLWEVHLIEDFRGDSLAVMRFHHAIADGSAMVRVMYDLMDPSSDASPSNDRPDLAQRKHSAFPGHRLLEPARQALKMGGQVSNILSRELRESLRRPTRAFELGQTLGQGAAVLGNALAMAPDHDTPFKGQLGKRKHVAMSAPVALQAVKDIGAATGTKVNDVLLSAMAGALGHYLAEERGVDVAQVSIRAVVPVDLRRQPSTKLGNEFGVVFLELPIGIDNPLQRLYAIKHGMDKLKASPEPYVFFSLLNVFGMAPDVMETQIVNLFGSKATLVMTNVKGPPEPLHFAGRAVKDMTFWVPQSGRLGMGVSIMSYAGEVRLGVITDAGLVPDPQTITTRFAEEFTRLRGRLAG
ncbi:MAG: wax ester/triacylglycerol synthase family O-acyltransferase [Pseudomonadota bacterium]